MKRFLNLSDFIAKATNGQLLIGSTGVDPVLATITGTTNQITITTAAGSITLSIPANFLIPTVITVPNEGLHLLESGGSPTHDLIIKAGSALGADRILTLTTGDAARTITLSGNPTLADWFDQAVKVASSPYFKWLLGYRIRSKFTWKDADEIYIDPGVYEVNGKIVYWDTQLISDIGSPAASDWHYLYLDYSEISASGIITTAKLIWSNTEPAWSVSKHGWYNGNDRCIFAVRTDGSSNILEFFHEGDFVVFADYIQDRGTAALSTTWTDVTLTIPKFAIQANCIMIAEYGSSGMTNALRWRTDGQTGTTGHIACAVSAGTTIAYIPSVVVASAAQIIEVVMSGANDTAGVRTNGWYFPIGL